MDFKGLYQGLKTLEEQQKFAVEKSDARIEELSKQLVGVKQELEVAQKRAEDERSEKIRAQDKLEDFESEFVRSKTNVAARIATLKAEQEVIARRDRESRNELDRLQHMKQEQK